MTFRWPPDLPEATEEPKIVGYLQEGCDLAGMYYAHSYHAEPDDGTIRNDQEMMTLGMIWKRPESACWQLDCIAYCKTMPARLRQSEFIERDAPLPALIARLSDIAQMSASFYEEGCFILLPVLVAGDAAMMTRLAEHTAQQGWRLLPSDQLISHQEWGWLRDAPVMSTLGSLGIWLRQFEGCEIAGVAYLPFTAGGPGYNAVETTVLCFRYNQESPWTLSQRCRTQKRTGTLLDTRESHLVFVDGEPPNPAESFACTVREAAAQHGLAGKAEITLCARPDIFADGVKGLWQLEKLIRSQLWFRQAMAPAPSYVSPEVN